MPAEISIKPLVMPVPRADIRVRRDVIYRDDMDADIFRPADGERFPAIIFIHGGPIPDGARGQRMRMFSDYGPLAAAMGFTGIIFSHRYWGSEGILRSADDVAALIEFAHQQPEVDPERLVFWAFSGGGAFLSFAFNQHDVCAMVAYYAALDVITPELRARLSPVERLRSGAHCPPVFIARAGNDYPRLNATIDQFVAEALRRNVELELMTHAEGVHGFDVLNDDDRSRAIIRRTFEFIRGHACPP